MVKKIAVYAEGPTEWYVVRKLYKRGILSGANLMGHDKSEIGKWLKGLDGLQPVLKNPPADTNGILLVYDQEAKATPEKIVDVLREKYNLQSLPTNPKFLTLPNATLPIALHVSAMESPDGNRDFDGYIWDVIQRGGGELIKALLQDEKSPAYLRERMKERKITEQLLYVLGAEQIPNTMQNTNWPPFRSKTNLYAFGTALQLNRSHVWLAEKIVEVAQTNLLQDVFASLITTWNELVENIL